MGFCGSQKPNIYVIITRPPLFWAPPGPGSNSRSRRGSGSGLATRISLSTKRHGSTEAHRGKTFLWERRNCSLFMPGRAWFTDRTTRKTEHPEKVLIILQFPAISEPFRNVVGSDNRYYANFAISPLFLTNRSAGGSPAVLIPWKDPRTAESMPCQSCSPRALPLCPGPPSPWTPSNPYVLSGITYLKDGKVLI